MKDEKVKEDTGRNAIHENDYGLQVRLTKVDNDDINNDKNE